MLVIDHVEPGGRPPPRLGEPDGRLVLVPDAIERVEIAMRVKVGHTLGKRDAHAHLHPQHLDGRFCTAQPGQQQSRYDTWLRKVREAQSRSTEDFVKHFRQRYGGRLPVWVVTEIMDFGCLSHLYSGSKREDRAAIAYELKALDAAGSGNGAALTNWMHVLNYLRNVCAHHSRLWNRNMTVQIAPKHLRAIPPLAHLARAGSTAPARVYAGLGVLGFLLRRIDPQAAWCAELADTLIGGLTAATRSAAEMGFPDGWQDLPLPLWNAGSHRTAPAA